MKTACAKISLALAVTASLIHPLHGQSTWTGGVGDYNEAANWSTGIVPDATAEIILGSGTAQLSGSDNLFERAAASRIDGGALELDDYRFLNGRGGPATFDMVSGSLDMAGTYFIVAQNNAGTINQSGGTVTLDLRRGFFLADTAAGSNTGTYALTGGTLDVSLNGLEANSDGHNFWLGRSSAGADLFQVDGGTFNLRNSGTLGDTDKRLYILRNSTFQVDSGAVDVDGMTYFVVGRGNHPGTKANMFINGGTTEVGVTNAFIVGGGQSGHLRVNDGTLSVVPSHTGAGDFWIGDGGSTTYATVEQTGGTLDIAGTLTLGRNANVDAPEYLLRGGNLVAGALQAGLSPNGRFYFQDGTIQIAGDGSTLVSEPWFITLGTPQAIYDSISDRTTITTTAPATTPASYRYFRFQADLLGSALEAGTVQLAEFEFLNAGAALDLSAATVTNPGGDNLIVDDAPVHPADLVADGNVNSKWLDSNNAPLVFDFGSEVTIDGYRFTTANDLPARDPVRWTLEGSADGSNWVVIDRNIRADLTPRGRQLRTLDFPLPASVEEGDLVWTGSESGDWDLSDLNWDEGGARSWNNAGLPARATFDGATPLAITVTEPVTIGEMDFQAPGYAIGGSGPLTLAGAARVETSEDATISTPIEGISGLKKTGSAQLTLSGANSYSGSTTVDAGELNIAGNGSLSGGGGFILAGGASARATLRIDTTDTVEAPGAMIVGGGQDAAAAVRLLSGTLVTNGPGVTYTEFGGGASSTKTAAYGALHLEGGRFDAGGGGSASGIRVGNDGLGLIEQTGGELIVPRWFAIGGEGNLEGEGVVNLLGGTTEVASGFRFLISDRTGSIGTLNIGSLAGGSAEVTSLNTTGLTVGSNTNAERATLNLNAGQLTLGGPLYRNSANATAIVNLNGGTLRAGADESVLVADSLTAANLFRGGLTVDTNDFVSRITADLIRPLGSGVYPAGGEIAVPDGGSGYLGAPIVRVATDGSGSGLTATARLDGDAVVAVVLTSPGESFAAGDLVSFTFHGGGATAPAVDFDYELTPGDLADNDAGTLTVTGGGRLILDGEVASTGATQVLGNSILEVNNFLGETELTVGPGSTLTGAIDTLGAVNINGSFAPGTGVGLARGLSAIRFGPDASYQFQVVDWTGTAGLGYDSAEFDDTALSTTTSQPFRVEIDGTGIRNFAEENRSFVLVDSFSVSGLTADNWTVSTSNFPGSGTWAVEDQDGRLVLAYTAGSVPFSPYAFWASGFEELTDADPAADPDGDGLPNLLEFVLLSDPTVPNAGNLAQGALDSAGDFVFTFVRSAESVSATSQSFQYSEDLVSWTTLPIPASSTGNIQIETDVPAAGSETVTVRIPATDPARERLFGRLQVLEAAVD